MCSYCGCQAIEIIGRFTAEHEDIVNGLGDLRRSVASGVEADIASSAAALAGMLDPHTASEERSLFAELRQDEEFTDEVDQLCAEHHGLDAQLSAIAGGRHDVMADFEVALRRHIDREENGLFPAAAIALGGDAWERVHAVG
ncbi:hemerythrin domain-containing protein [Knoellia aerolata]|uniref:Hemerythrin n=1 Tax=Knoellia aerolata DSM 18566 TaxID=1385519 RepID=A0A0A0JW66_9MICO|nr:hemerythrin domain-containing protein [Knoellia aerolata]KGN39861.1 hemerythrin [Knoellia aerolata DSM 18566]